MQEDIGIEEGNLTSSKQTNKPEDLAQSEISSYDNGTDNDEEEFKAKHVAWLICTGRLDQALDACLEDHNYSDALLIGVMLGYSV